MMRTVVAALIAATALVTLPAAHADPADTDAVFWATLEAAGIADNFPTENAAVLVAESRCMQMQSGERTPTAEIANLATQNGGLFGLDVTTAAEFLGAAMRLYCPDVAAKYGLADGKAALR
jgi:Protein of unknown function (DUF732)